MGENYEAAINDTYRAIERISESLKDWESPLTDKRVKAMILSKLQEARLLSLELIIKNKPL